MKNKTIAAFFGLGILSVSTVTFAENLLDVFQQAKANDPVVLRAEAQFKASEENIKQAIAVMLPQITAFASYERAKNKVNDFDPQYSNNTSMGTSLSMDLYRHSSWINLSASRKTAHQSDIAYQLAKQELILRVTTAYFNVLGAKDDVEFAKAEKKAVERQLEQTKQRFEVGLTDITDVHETQAQFDNTITAEIIAVNNVYNAEEALREITNNYPNNLHVLNTTKFSVTRPIPEGADEWQKRAEDKNLSLIFQKISVDLARHNIQVSRAGHLPTLSLRGSYVNNETGTPAFNQAGTFNSQSVGVEMNVPIFLGGSVTSAVRQAQSNFVATSQDLEQTHRNVVRNTRNAYNTVIANVSAIKSLEQSVISAESALRATEAGMEVGIRTIVDVLDSTRNLYNAKRNLSSTRYAYIQAILSLKQAAGMITEDDLTGINDGLMALK